MTYKDFDDYRIKHLELIQAVITRLASYQFLLRGWALTVAGVFLGFAVNNKEWRLALVSLAPTVTFWGLDMYFLRNERLFRALFKRVREFDVRIEPFFMAATDAKFEKMVTKEEKSWSRTFRRPALLFFYFGILIFTIATLWWIAESSTTAPMTPRTGV
jgi:hypothetical protein